MGQGPRKEGSAAVAAGAALLLLVVAPGGAQADPVVAHPPLGKGLLRVDDEGRPHGSVAFVAEASILAVLGVERATTFPEVGQLTGGEPHLARARLGLVGGETGAPLAFSVRVDLSEGLRIDRADYLARPLQTANRFVDDAYVWWTPRSTFGAIAGRQKVPFSRFRQADEALLAAVAPPFLVDRIAPDRRWGVTATGEQGALAWAAGVYEDWHRLAAAADDDPSAAGVVAAAAHVEWAPRGSLGEGHLPVPRADRAHERLRTSTGAGLLVRGREQGGTRIDLSLSGGFQLRLLSAITETILSHDDGETALSAAAEAGVLVTDQFYLFARADTDPAVDLRSAGAGVVYFATADRRNKLTFLAWARRDGDRGPRRDGIILQLHASL
jgi:hypothetical protein